MESTKQICVFPAQLLHDVSSGGPQERFIPSHFEQNQLVEVQKRLWVGINKEGGVGKVIACNPPRYAERPQGDAGSDYDSGASLGWSTHSIDVYAT